MTEPTERREDSATRLIVRIAVLEAKHEEALRIRVYQEAELSRLGAQDSKMADALNEINGKFDSLIAKFSIGYKVLAVGATVLVASIGGFTAYNAMLDAKYKPKIDYAIDQVNANRDHSDQAKAQVRLQAELLKQQQEAVEDVADKVERIKKLKVIRASRTVK
ncbi:MAG: hypothetical protein PHT88_04905 [Candidatus Moranbacteria bacterium]|nr:hypothetical protein [Candidatus Moranbacteria bacterium]